MKADKLENLFLHEMVIIQKYLMKIGASKEEAEDIGQDTLCKAIEYADVLDEYSISSWLFKVSLNNYYNLYKRKKSKVYLDDHMISALNSNLLVENTILNTELRKNIETVLASMKESYRSLIIMKYCLGLSYKDIGRILAMDENMVKTYLYRARSKFKDLWRY